MNYNWSPNWLFLEKKAEIRGGEGALLQPPQLILTVHGISILN
jgi:hypothetical protein